MLHVYIYVYIYMFTATMTREKEVIDLKGAGRRKRSNNNVIIFLLLRIANELGWLVFVVNLTEDQFIWEKGTSSKKMPPSGGPVGKSVRQVLDKYKLGRAQLTGDSTTPLSRAGHEKEASKQRPLWPPHQFLPPGSGLGFPQGTQDT